MWQSKRTDHMFRMMDNLHDHEQKRQYRSFMATVVQRHSASIFQLSNDHGKQKKSN